mgnify:CR=1 FL=1
MLFYLLFTIRFILLAFVAEPNRAGATRSHLSGCGSFGCHKKLKILDTFGIIRVMVCCNGNQITGQADEKPNICSTSMAVGSIKIIVFIGLKFEGMIDF